MLGIPSNINAMPCEDIPLSENTVVLLHLTFSLVYLSEGVQNCFSHWAFDPRFMAPTKYLASL